MQKAVTKKSRGVALVLVGILSCGSVSHAQSIPFESFKIADIVMTSGWENMEKNLLPGVLMKLESDLKAGSATNNAAKVFVEEFRSVFGKDNFTKATAEVIAKKMTIDEQRQTLTFLQSEAGRKYGELSGGKGDEMLQAIVPMLKQACQAANAKLGLFDRGSLNSTCGRL